MPRKPVTWFGSVVILGAGIFCFSGLLRYRSQLDPSSAQAPLITGAAFLALIVSVGAIFLWYYFNEKQ